MKARIKFRKIGPIKFIGHLDLMRTFQKIFRRSNLPIAYSEGFNPHQIFSIAAPLALGVTSDGEYLDAKFTEHIDINSIKEALNKSCPKGITILDVVELSDREPAAMASVAFAKYRISLNDVIFSKKQIDDYLNQTEIIIQKKSKKGKIRDIDIRPGILSIELVNEDIIMIIATGSKLNIKPELCLQSLTEYLNIPYNRFDYVIHREELYTGKDLNPLSAPMEGAVHHE